MRHAALRMVGLSHKTAPVAVRERLAVGPDAVGGALKAADPPGGGERVILSTCNRVEIYYTTNNENADPYGPARRLAELRGADWASIQPALYVREGLEVARHLFRVVTGLESMVIGEEEITGQVRAALTAARTAGTAGHMLGTLFARALSSGRRIRAATGLGRNRASVAGAAVAFAEQRLGEIVGRTVLVIGAGENSESVLRELLRRGVASTIVSNRNAARAHELADEIGGRVVPFDQFEEALAEADIVVSSTSAPHVVVRCAALARAMEARADRPLLVIDLAVPRDVEPAAGGLPGVHLRNIDDLVGVVAEQHSRHEEEIEASLSMVEEAVRRFDRWCRRDRLAPLIQALNRKAAAVQQTELARLCAGRPELTQAQREAIARTVRRTVRKLLHGPIQALKRAAADDEPTDAAELFEEMFLRGETEDQP